MQPTQDPGSNLNDAYNLGNITDLQSFTEFIGSTDTTDTYKFSLTEISNLDLSVTDYDGDLDLQVIIDRNQNGQIDDDETIYSKYYSSIEYNSTLGAGDYFIRVLQGSSTTNTNYNLNLFSTPAPSSTDTDPGSTLTTAYNLGNITELQSFTEFIGSTDTSDVYQFSLTEISYFDLSLTDYDDYLKLQVIIDSNQNDRIDDEIIYNEYHYESGEYSSVLGEGNYFLRLLPDSSTTNTNYNLNLSSTPAHSSTDSDPGSTLTTAYSLGNITELQSFTEFIGSTDTSDVYQFSLTEISYFDLSVTDYDGYLDLEVIIDSNQNGKIDDNETIYSQSHGSRKYNSVLGAGNYFIRVLQGWSSTNTNYNLDLSSTPTPPSTDTDPGSTLTTAYNLGNIADLQSLSEFIGSTDTSDVYQFSLTEISYFDLSLTDYSGSLDLQVIIDSNQNGRIDDDEIIYDEYYESGEYNSVLGAGDYFVLVKQKSSKTNTNYNLDLSSTPFSSSTDTDPGNNLSTAYNLGNITDLQSFTEFVGSTDTTDIYKFSLNEISDLDLSLTDYDGYLNLEVIIDRNQNGRIDDDEKIYSDYYDSVKYNSALGVGDYFIRLLQGSNTTNTNYNLDISSTPTPSSTDTDPGSNLTTAYNLGNIADLQSLSEFIGSTDTSDIYKFSLDQISDLDLSLTDYDGYLNLEVIIDRNQNGRIDEDEIIYDEYDDDSENYNSALGAGDYFIRVLQKYSTTNTNYNLDISSTPAFSSTDTDPGSDLNTAYQVNNINLNTLEDSHSFTEFIGSTDTSDIYKFSLLQNTELDLSLTDFDGRLDIQIIVDRNQNGRINDDEVIFDDYYYDSGKYNSALGAGDYFIRLLQRRNTTNTSYDLNLNYTAEAIDSIVTVETLDSEASEKDSDTGVVRISRRGNTSKAQTVTYTIDTGDRQARNGVDYAELSGSVIIPEDRYYVDLVVTPIDDGHPEILEQVNITLTEVDNDGVVGMAKTAMVTIADDDRPDSLPYVSNQIADIRVSQNAANKVINLSSVFKDLDGDEIALTVKTNSNSELVETSFNGKNLTLDFAEGKFGTSDITIEATANGVKVSDTFSIVVDEVVDSSQMLLTEVHRFYQHEKGFHLYTSDTNEIGYIKERSSMGEMSYRYESEKYKVLADDKDTITGEEIEEVAPIYRFFNNETGAHLYTMDENEKNYIKDNLNNYSFEGIKYYAFKSEPENIDTTGVYRMLNTQSGAHLFSTDMNEIGYIQENMTHFSMENNGNAAFYVFEL